VTPTVAVLGTGIMGGPIARNLAAAGFEVRAWNRTREKAEPLAEHGVAVMNTPAEAVKGSDVVLTMLADGAAVEGVTTEGGALAGMPEDAVWLQTSTVGIAAAERLAALADQAGVGFVDAPVLGTKQPAEEGALVVLASGPEEARAVCQPIWDVIGNRTIWLGDAGAGTRLKLVINNWLVNLVEALAETIAFASAIGIDPRAFIDAIDGGAVGPPYARLKGEMMIGEKFEPAFPLRLALKDTQLVLEAAERHGIELPLARATAERFKRAVELGHGEEDLAAAYYAAADGKSPD
jgi:3-hydroxyisobutyrate dehydrogenase